MSLASTVSPRQVLTAFRAIAAVEAVTWAGLLVGMFFKYVVVHNEIGVQIFGPIHGSRSSSTWRSRCWPGTGSAGAR